MATISHILKRMSRVESKISHLNKTQFYYSDFAKIVRISNMLPETFHISKNNLYLFLFMTNYCSWSAAYWCDIYH